ncbi:MAG: hypothetical protein HZB36_01030 [Candidatus Omnitrophica bacterium]|nr:hypothetical protein [Candidatus Omnitrophota bacterium]
MTKWAICCPGKSLGLYQTTKKIEALQPDFRVAVNGAILSDIPFDYWAVQDLEVFAAIGNISLAVFPVLRISKAVLWVPARWVVDIKRYHAGVSAVFDLFKKELFPSDSKMALAEAMPFGRELEWQEYTLLAAIALAVIKGGVIIHIFGADWAGQGYFADKLENNRTLHNDKRWQRERMMFEIIQKECARNGVHVVREEAYV